MSNKKQGVNEHSNPYANLLPVLLSESFLIILIELIKFLLRCPHLRGLSRGVSDYCPNLRASE